MPGQGLLGCTRNTTARTGVWSSVPPPQCICPGRAMPTRGAAPGMGAPPPRSPVRCKMASSPLEVGEAGDRTVVPQGNQTSTIACATSMAAWADGDALRLQLADGRHVYAEVLAVAPPSAAAQPRHGQKGPAAGSAALAAGCSSTTAPQLLCQGTRYMLQPAPMLPTPASGEATCDGPPLALVAMGGALASNDSLLSLLASPHKQHVPALRAWAPLMTRLVRPGQAAPTQQQQQAPDADLDGSTVLGATWVTSREDLRQRAVGEPGTWCDGTGPSDPPLSGESQIMYTAGELACLLEGRRGVVLLQLHVGWEEHDNIPPYGPYKPLVLRLLREALGRPDIVSYASPAPTPDMPGGNAGYGLTMVLCADREPYKSWGAHLASFGCQAALEAQSPYYKLLIGRVLGYQPKNIAHHIKTKHGQEPAREVVAVVEQQLVKLSPKQPKLPWNANSRGGSRKKAK